MDISKLVVVDSRREEALSPEGEEGARRPHESFVQAWERNVSSLYRYCLFWTGGSEEAAEEALSRVAAVAFQKLPQVEGDSVWERKWLLTVTRNVCMDLHRERRRKREQSLEDFPELDPPEPSTPSSAPESPEERFLQGELRAYLWRSIRELPPRLRGPITLHVLHEMSHREIAGTLSITEVSVRKRLQEARDLLRGQLQDYLAGAGRVDAEDRELDLHGSALLPMPEAEEIAHARTLGSVRIAVPDRPEVDILLPFPKAPASRWQKRSETLSEYVRKHPGGWKKRLELARLLALQGLWENALLHYRFVVECQPDLLVPRAEMGRLLRGAGRENEAVALWQAGLRPGTRPAVRHHLMALIAAVSRPAEAEAALREAVAVEPQSSLHRVALAEILIGRARPVEAIAALDDLLARDPDNVAALLLGQEPLLACDRPREAERRAERALRLEPANPLALARVVDFRISAGRFGGQEGQRTRQLLQRLERVGQDRAETHAVQARLLLATGNRGLAVERSAEFVKRHLRHARGWWLHGRLLVQIGRPREAVYAFSEALSLSPHEAGLGRDLAQALALLGRLLEARRVLETFLEARSEAWFLLTALALLLPKAGDGARRAAELTLRAVELLPQLSSVWFERARVLGAQGHRPQAIAAVRTGWDLLPPDDGYWKAAQAALLAAECHREQGQTEAAREWLARALQAADRLALQDPATALALRGEALLLQGDCAQALRAFRAALDHGLVHPLRTAVETAAAACENEAPQNHESPSSFVS